MPQFRDIRFSLRTLIIAVCVLSVVFGVVAAVVHKARRQRQAIAAIRGSGGLIVYDMEPGFHRLFAENEHFGRVLIVNFVRGQATDASLRDLHDDLSVLHETQVTESGLKDLLKEFPDTIVHVSPSHAYLPPSTHEPARSRKR